MTPCFRNRVSKNGETVLSIYKKHCFMAKHMFSSMYKGKHSFPAQVQTIFKTRVLKTSKKLKTLVSLEPVADHTKNLGVKFTKNRFLKNILHLNLKHSMPLETKLIGYESEPFESAYTSGYLCPKIQSLFFAIFLNQTITEHSIVW